MTDFGLDDLVYVRKDEVRHVGVIVYVYTHRSPLRFMVRWHKGYATVHSAEELIRVKVDTAAPSQLP